ncbi:MAG: hypothetical protein KF752_08535 [Pirellulaceae bacterium]|nr:hypothetical protein [Pirellulaceae bacterium]
MAKFYVQSGNFRTTLTAADAEKAALWVVHQAMRQVVPVYDDNELTPDEKGHTAVAEGLMVLGNSICVSELGFDSSATVSWDTFELVTHWHQLMLALDRLADMVCALQPSVHEECVS